MGYRNIYPPEYCSQFEPLIQYMQELPTVTEYFLQELYLIGPSLKTPWLQILAFEPSESNPNEIMYLIQTCSIRLSDKLNYVDCTLSGPYSIVGDKIIGESPSKGTFQKYDLIRMVEYFSKIDESKISRLKVMVRKMAEGVGLGVLLGFPAEIGQFIVNFAMDQSQFYQNRYKKDSRVDQSIILTQHKTAAKNIPRPQISIDKEDEHMSNVKKECKLDNESSFSSAHNYEPPHSRNQEPPRTAQKHPLVKNTASHVQTISRKYGDKMRHCQQSLSLNEIMSGREGFMVGRLLRLKHTVKLTKQTPMTVIYCVFLNLHGELVRVHLAGRVAMSNQKVLHKDKCYYVTGFDIVSIKTNAQQIRLKDKEYKVIELYNEEIDRNIGREAWHWDHEQAYPSSLAEPTECYVDIVGTVEEIEEKTIYGSVSVVRVLVRNKTKSVRIGFWRELILLLTTSGLKKGDNVVMEDVRRKVHKETIYYDFNFESNLCKLQDAGKFKKFMSEPNEYLHEINIKMLVKLNEQPSQKIHTINGYFLHPVERASLVFQLCQDCNKKHESASPFCDSCNSENLSTKFNCLYEFSDWTGSIIVVIYDNLASKLFSRTAVQVQDMSQEESDLLVERIQYQEFAIGIQFRKKWIVRTVQPIEETNAHRIIANLHSIRNLQISRYLQPSRDYSQS